MATFAASILYAIPVFIVMGLAAARAEVPVQHNLSLVSQYGDTVPQIAWHLITHPSTYLNRTLAASVVKVSRPLAFINCLAPEVYLLAIPKSIIGIVTSKLRMDGAAFEFPWHMTQNLTFAFLSFIYGLSRLKAAMYWILTRLHRRGRGRSDMIRSAAHRWSDRLLICVVTAVVIPAAFAFANEYPHRRIMTMDISTDARLMSRMADRFRNLIPKDKLIAVHYSLLKDLHDYPFISFDRHSKTVQRIVEKEPHFLIVPRRDRQFTKKMVLTRLKDEKDLSYDVIFEEDVIVYSRLK